MRYGLADVAALRRPVVVVVGQQALHGGAAVTGAVEDLEQHGVGHLEAGGQMVPAGRPRAG